MSKRKMELETENKIVTPDEVEEVLSQEPVKETPKPAKGFPWEEITGEPGLAQKLRANDFYTYRDLEKNPRAVLSFLKEYPGVDYAALMEAAYKHEQQLVSEGEQ